MSFEHLRQSAERCFADAAALAAERPEASLARRSSGHSVLAAYYLANNDARANEEIRAFLLNELRRYEAFVASVRTFAQHTLLILALAIGELSLARTIAALPIDRQSWSKFDAYITHRICAILNVPQVGPEPSFKPTKSEEGFVAAVEAVARTEPFNPAQVEAFWKALRSKRYQLTIFEHANLFAPALVTLRNAA